MKETKAFYKTSEFWLLLIGQLVLTLQSSDVVNLTAEKYNWITPILQVLLAAAYIISRGQAKSGVPPAEIMPIPGIEEFSVPALVKAPEVPVDTSEQDKLSP